nr:MAG TPA: hypothetical protein [Caudoviricetes sp.]
MKWISISRRNAHRRIRFSGCRLARSLSLLENLGNYT